jgi:pyruvate kinase
MIPRKTKIVCTIGPSSSGKEMLRKLINTGMDTARLNFSHGTYEQHKQVINDIRMVCKECSKQIAILQDLQGPKIRTGKIMNGAVNLENGQEFIITIDELDYGNSQKVSTNYINLIKEVKAGKQILLDDGYIILNVEKISGNDIITTVIKGGELKDNKGIITPGVSSSAPSLSEKDFEDLKFGLKAGVDAVALSFVRSEKDIIELRTAMKIFGRTVPIISKIERYEGYEDIEDIIDESDGIMVARGDLGLEMPAEQVPILQKEIIKKCNHKGKPVIIATQMLESMIHNPRPTRAEASDVANAVIDGADSVMLSGETSIGKYPLEAVDYMHRIIKVVENKYISEKGVKLDVGTSDIKDISDALGKASCVIARQIDASAIISLTGSGYTAQNISKYRPYQPIVALSENEETLRLLSFIWGVEGIYVPDDLSNKEIFRQIGDLVSKLDYIKKGDNICFVAGLASGEAMPENMLKVYKIE